MQVTTGALGSKVVSKVAIPGVITRPMVIPAIAQISPHFEPLLKIQRNTLATQARLASQSLSLMNQFEPTVSTALTPSPPLKIIVLMSEDAKGCITANLLSQSAQLQGHSVALMIAPTDRPATTKRKRNYNTRYGRFEMEFFNKYFVPWVERLPAARRGRNKMKTFDELRSDFEIIRLRHGENINDPPMLSALAAAEPDVMISARFMQIFKEDVLKIPKQGIWNVHPGEMHRYKGIHVDMQAMRFGEDKVGVVLHQVDAGIDTGLIHSTIHVDIPSNSSLLSIRASTAAANAALISRLVGEFTGMTPPTVLSEHPTETCTTKASGYFSWPTLEQYAEFEQRHCFVDNQSLVDMMSLFSDEVLPEEFIDAYKAGQPQDDVTASTMFQFNKC